MAKRTGFSTIPSHVLAAKQTSSTAPLAIMRSGMFLALAMPTQTTEETQTALRTGETSVLCAAGNRVCVRRALTAFSPQLPEALPAVRVLLVPAQPQARPLRSTTALLHAKPVALALTLRRDCALPVPRIPTLQALATLRARPVLRDPSTRGRLRRMPRARFAPLAPMLLF